MFNAVGARLSNTVGTRRSTATGAWLSSAVGIGLSKTAGAWLSKAVGAGLSSDRPDWCGAVAGSGPLAYGPVTINILAGEVDGRKAIASVGVNTAISRCDPAASIDVVCDALPLLTCTGAPTFMAPSLNCTVPAAGGWETVALNVTAVPWATDGAGEMVNSVLLGRGATESATGTLPAEGGVVATTPVTNNHTPMAAAATIKILIASQCTTLPMRMMASLFCVCCHQPTRVRSGR
jgi:hypothetical protein